MKYRCLGNSGLLVSEIGFGAWGIGGGAGGHPAYGVTDDKESVNALSAALCSGVTFFDTSDLYGMGHSEELIGRAFRNKRDQVVIATKGGIVNPKGDQDFSPEYLRCALERSLIRLGSDYVDVYQLHSPPLKVLAQGDRLLSLFETLIREGKVRVVGLSARSPQEALYAVEHLGLRCVQVNLNLLDWRAIDCGLLQRCRELDIAIIARTPLCFGFLTGRYSVDDVSDPNDHRARWPRDRVEGWITASSLIGAIITSGGEQTTGQKALRFCLSFDGVASVIPGMLTPSQVTENVRASQLGRLTTEELAEVEQVYRENYC